jgi:sec-independent protein translocase protein TatB
MFDIGFTELMVIALVALIVLGPERLPEVARTLGRWAGRAQRFMEKVRQDIDRELKSEELEKIKKLEEELNETRTLIENSSDKIKQSLTEETGSLESYLDQEKKIQPAPLEEKKLSEEKKLLPAPAAKEPDKKVKRSKTGIQKAPRVKSAVKNKNGARS